MFNSKYKTLCIYIYMCIYIYVISTIKYIIKYTIDQI